MISPETFRKYPFFGPFDSEVLKELAMISTEVQVAPGDTIFVERQPANSFYLLLEGGIDLYIKSEEEFHPKASKTFSVGEINPGEVFAISSLIEPYILTATARASSPSKLVKIDAVALRALVASDPKMGRFLMHQVAKAAMERLAYVRVQLAAAWA